MPRPPTLTESQKTTILELRRNHMTFSRIAKVVGLSTRTTRNWHYKRLMREAGIL